jgi:hypothetical protein
MAQEFKSLFVTSGGLKIKLPSATDAARLSQSSRVVEVTESPMEIVSSLPSLQHENRIRSSHLARNVSGAIQDFKSPEFDTYLETLLRQSLAQAVAKLMHNPRIKQQWLNTRSFFQITSKDYPNIPAFKRVVDEAASKGYLLLDISNPTISKNTILSVRKLDQKISAEDADADLLRITTELSSLAF